MPDTPQLSHAESKAAYERARPMLKPKLGIAAWGRAEWIEHWLKIQANPPHSFGAMCADEALFNLAYLRQK